MYNKENNQKKKKG